MLKNWDEMFEFMEIEEKDKVKIDITYEKKRNLFKVLIGLPELIWLYKEDGNPNKWRTAYFTFSNNLVNTFLEIKPRKDLRNVMKVQLHYVQEQIK